MTYRLEKNYAKGEDIVIDGWEKGIASSPETGLSDIRNCNTSSIPGVIYANSTTVNSWIYPIGSANYKSFVATFTAVAATDIITAASTIPSNYYAVTFSNTGGALPTGLSAGTIYYISWISGPGTTAKVSTTIQNAIAGVYIDITGAGSGTNTITAVTMGYVRQTASQWYGLDSGGASSSKLFCFDSNGRVWGYSYAVQGTWTLITGAGSTSAVNGIAVFQNWLFLFRGNVIDVYGNLTGAITTHTWSNSWKTLNSSTTYSSLRKTLVGQDTVLYWTDYNDAVSSPRLGYIGSLRELPGQTLFSDTGNPATSSATTNYNFNNNSLDLPAGEEPQALAELNSNLVIATGRYGQYMMNEQNSSKLYTWDRFSPSFNFPLSIPATPVMDLVNIDNIIYIFSGRMGIVYKTDLSSVKEALTIPRQLYTIQNPTSYNEGMPFQSQLGLGNPGGYNIDGMGFGYKSLIFGKKIYFTCSFISGSAVYSWDTTKNVLNIEFSYSGGYGSNISSDIVNLFEVCWVPQNNADPVDLSIMFFGLQYTGSTTPFIEKYYIPSNTSTDYNAYVISDLIPVGTRNNRKTLEQIEYKLDQDMIAASGIKLYYRTAIGDAWTLITTDDFVTYGNIDSRLVSLPLADIEWIQIKANLNFATRLREIRLR